VIPRLEISIISGVHIAKQSNDFFLEKRFYIDFPVIGLVDNFPELTPEVGAWNTPQKQHDK